MKENEIFIVYPNNDILISSLYNLKLNKKYNVYICLDYVLKYFLI